MPYRRNLGTPPLIGEEPWPRPVQSFHQAVFDVGGNTHHSVAVLHEAGDETFSLHVNVRQGSVWVELSPSEWAELRGAANRAAERIEDV